MVFETAAILTQVVAQFKADDGLVQTLGRLAEHLATQVHASVGGAR